MLRIHKRNLDNVAVFCLEGRIVNGETEDLRAAIYSQSNTRTIVLDLSRVSAIDASGLGLLLELRRYAQSQGIHFKLMRVTNMVRRVFEVTRLDSVFEVIPRVERTPAIARSRSASMFGLAPCA